MISEVGKKHMCQLFFAKNEQHGAELLQSLPKSELMMLMLDAREIVYLVLMVLGVDETIFENINS